MKKSVKKPVAKKIVKKTAAKKATGPLAKRINAHVTRVMKGEPVGRAADAIVKAMPKSDPFKALPQWRGRTLSKYSMALADAVRNGKGNYVLQARAGSGKTTNLELVVDLLPAECRVVSIAFNKHIATELQARMPANVTCCTMNSLGFGVCRANGAWRLDAWKTANILQRFFNMNDRESKRDYYGMRGSICKAVSLLKGQLCVEMPEESVVVKMLQHYEVDAPANGEFGRWFEMLKNVYQLCLDEVVAVDFDDQWFLPLLMGWALPKFDFILVDESQDMCPAQIEFIARLQHAGGGRVLAVGDEAQAIYGFRGADAEAMRKMQQRLAATVLPLSICYRCGKNIIREAQKIVPDIEYWDQSPDGTIVNDVEDKYLDQMKDGDFVLCRTTAPLVAQCLKMIRASRKAVVRGRDIGKNLLELLRKVAYGNYEGEGMTGKLAEYGHTETQKLLAAERDAEAQSLEDRVETLIILCEGCVDVKAVEQKVERIFSDESVGVTFCTVHRSKGLEAEHVAIIHPELMPHPMAKQDHQKVQEMNLKYVAITRAQRVLRWVTMNPKK